MLITTTFFSSKLIFYGTRTFFKQLEDQRFNILNKEQVTSLVWACEVFYSAKAKGLDPVEM